MFADQFQTITESLEGYKECWSKEIIAQYPNCFELYPEEWIDSLAELSDFELFEFERLNRTDLVKSKSLQNYCRKMQEIAHFDYAPISHSCSLSNHALIHINQKKRHEINRILGVLEQLRGTHRIDRLIDLGGGIGNLARIIAKQYNIESNSIDFNPTLQKTGEKRYSLYAKAGCAPLSFHTANILELKELPQEITAGSIENTISLGLHTCGALANAQLRLSLQAELPIIFNFSCCYNKMEESDYYFSEIGIRNGLRLGPTARVLASHTPRNDRLAHDKWKRVKQYRYMIHLFLYHVLGYTDCLALGSSHPRLYQSSFLNYACEQLKRLEIVIDNSIVKLLEDFYNDPQYQETVKRMILANSLRSFAGRPLEALFILDRAMFLAENDYIVQAKQYFEPNISPRNIGILAIRKKKFGTSQFQHNSPTH